MKAWLESLLVFSHLLVTTSKTDRFHQQKIFLRLFKVVKIIISPFTPEEVIDRIKSLPNSSKSTVHNSILTKIIQTVKDKILIPLFNLIDKFFNIGTLPNICKIARVAPVFKIEARQLCNNYRSTALFSNISKTIEKLMHIRLK